MVNLWSSILERSSGRVMGPPASDAALVLVGHRGSGKRSLVKQLCERDRMETSRAPTDIGGNALLTYDYFDVDDRPLNNVGPRRVHVWAANEMIFEKSYDIFKGSIQEDRLMYAVQIDISVVEAGDADPVGNLRLWLRKVRSQCSANFPTKSSDNEVIPFPIVIIASKCDTICGAGEVSMEMRKAHESLQGELRTLCLQIGAGLVYTSALGETQKMNVLKLKQYVAHQLFPDQTAVVAPSVIEDGLDCAFVPTGSDSKELIESTLNYRIQDALPWTAEAPARVTNGEVATVDTGSVDRGNNNGQAGGADPFPGDGEEDEQVWLQDMYTYVSQADDASKGEDANNEDATMQPSRFPLVLANTDSFIARVSSVEKAESSRFFTILTGSSASESNKVSDSLEAEQSQVYAFMLFLSTLPVQICCPSSDGLRDGRVFLQCLHWIAPENFPADSLDDAKVSVQGSWKAAAANLTIVKDLLFDYFENILSKALPSSLVIDVEGIAKYGSLGKVLPLIKLTMGAAVLSDGRDSLIKMYILKLDEGIHCQLKNLVQGCQRYCEEAVLQAGGMVGIDRDKLFRAEIMNKHLLEVQDRVSKELDDMQRENTNLKITVEELSTKVGELEQIKAGFEGDGDHSLRAAEIRAATLEADLSEAKRDMDLMNVEADRLREINRVAEGKIEQLKEAAMSRDISIQLMKDELDVAREKSAKLIAAEGSIVKYKRQLESLSTLKQDYAEQLDLVQKYSNRISELESSTQGMTALNGLVEQLKSSSVEMERSKFEALSAVELKDHEIERLECELDAQSSAYKRLDQEFSLVRGELESMALEAASSDNKAIEEKNAELSALKVRVQELETDLKSKKSSSDSACSSSGVEQELIFCKAQLEQVIQEKKSREELLLDAKKKLAASQAERTRSQRSLADAQTALSAADAKLKAGREASHKLEQLQASTKMLEGRLKEKETAVLRLESQRRELEMFSRNKLESFKNKFMATLKAVQGEKEVLEASLERLASRAEFDRETSRREERLLLSAMYQIGVKIMDKNLKDDDSNP